MASHGQATRKAVWDMLDACAPGWKCKETDHFFRVMWKDKTYPSFPKHSSIDIGHVKRLVKFLGINACAGEHIPLLK